jgi:hypothetical protein
MKRIIQTSVALLLCLGAAVGAHAQWPLGREATQGSVKSGEPSGGITLTGRYQVFVSPNVKGHTFMLDTESGKVWIMKKDSASGDYSLQRIPVENVDDQPKAPDRGRGLDKGR